MKTTTDEWYAFSERFSHNQHEAKMRQMIAKIRKHEVLDPFLNPLKVVCVVCGEPVKAQRRSKQTCSNRCRLRLSRWRHAFRALPEKEKERRRAVVEKRIEKRNAAARAKAEAEKRKPKLSPEKAA